MNKKKVKKKQINRALASDKNKLRNYVEKNKRRDKLTKKKISPQT